MSDKAPTTEPRTAAGRAALNGGPPTFDDLKRLILAIEAEATTPAETGLREAVERAIDELDPNDPPVTNLNLLLHDLRTALSKEEK